MLMWQKSTKKDVKSTISDSPHDSGLDRSPRTWLGWYRRSQYSQKHGGPGTCLHWTQCAILDVSRDSPPSFDVQRLKAAEDRFNLHKFWRTCQIEKHNLMKDYKCMPVTAQEFCQWQILMYLHVVWQGMPTSDKCTTDHEVFVQP